MLVLKINNVDMLAKLKFQSSSAGTIRGAPSLISMDLALVTLWAPLFLFLSPRAYFTLLLPRGASIATIDCPVHR